MCSQSNKTKGQKQRTQKISRFQLAMVLRQIGVLINSGLPLDAALQQRNGRQAFLLGMLAANKVGKAYIKPFYAQAFSPTQTIAHRQQ